MDHNTALERGDLLDRAFGPEPKVVVILTTGRHEPRLDRFIHDRLSGIMLDHDQLGVLLTPVVAAGEAPSIERPPVGYAARFIPWSAISSIGPA